MATDFQEYFNSRINQEIENNAKLGVSTKYQEVQAASAKKIQDLDAGIAKAKQRELAAANSWVGKLGLDEDGAAGFGVNLAASFYKGASNTVGDITGFLAGDLEAMVASGSLSEPEIAAVSRYKQGIASPEDVALITRQPVERPGAHTALEMFDKAIAARQRSADINASFDRSDVVHQERREELSDQLGAGFQGAWDQAVQGGKALWGGKVDGAADLASGVAKLIYNAGEAAQSNPGAALEYIAENVPQLAIGAGGKAGKVALTVSNVGYASEEYQKGIAKYQAENGGAYPPEADRMQMAAYAASLALAEHVSDLGQLKAAKGAAQAAEDTGRIGFKQSILNTGKATAAGAGEETLTEGYQTFAEGQANLTPVTPQQIYEGAVIGGLAGGGMSGGGRALGELLKATPEHAAERAAEQARNEIQAAAVASGDVTALVDPKSKSYDPAAAIAALNGNASLDTATPEAKQANFEKASQIVADLEALRAEAQEAMDSTSPEALEGFRKQLEEAKAAGNQERAATLEGLLKVDPKAVKQQQAELADIDRRLAQAREQMTAFHQDLNEAEVDVDEAVQRINDKVEGAEQAAERLITLSMAAPERLDAEVALSLANNTDNALTDTQRSYLRQFSDARLAETEAKDMGGVTDEVMVGGNGNVGLSQHRERITAALAANNKVQADQLLNVLRSFQKDHVAKAAAAANAWARGKGSQILRGKAPGEWFVSPTLLPAAEVKRNKGMPINSPKLVNGIGLEAKVITKTLGELEAAYALKFSTAPKGEANVADASQPHPATPDAAAQDAQAPAAGGASTAADRSESTRVPDAGRRADVEAVGVAQKTQEDSQSTAVSTVDQVPAGTLVDESSAQKQSTNDVESSSTASPEVAGEATASSESAEQTSVQSEETGQLDALKTKSAEGTAFNLRNLIADYFTQTAAKLGDATQRPLVAVKNFLSEGWDQAIHFTQFTKFETEHETALKTFKAAAKAWSLQYRKDLTLDRQAYWYQDLTQFFIVEAEDGKLDLEENLKTAMSYAAFSWVAEQAGRSANNTDDEINAILGRDDDYRVEDHERNALASIGTRQNVVINTLGQRAMQALGLKAIKGAPADLQPRLQSQLGARIFKMLMEEGIVERRIVSGQEMRDLTRSDATDLNTQFQFLKLARKDGELHPKAEQIYRAARGTQSVLDKLFGVEAGLKEPSQEPIPFNQSTTRNTSQQVPEKLAKIVEHENAGASYVREDMWNLVSELDEELALDMAGAAPTDAETTHKANRDANQAKNDGLKRELERFKEYVQGAGIELPLYFEHTVWKQQRVGIATNMVNPQTSKIHRHMLFRKTWETEVDVNDDAAMENFRLRVAEGLGVKTDKQSNQKSLEAFEKKVAEPAIQAAVAVLVKRLGGQKLSRAEQETLRDGVAKGGENFHSLDALMALAHEAKARADGKSTFTVQLMGEVDGVTNGPMLSHLLMGAANTVEELYALLNRGGFYEQGNQHSQYNLWRGALGNFDLYETTALHMTQAVQKLINEGIYSVRKEIAMPGASVAKAMSAIYGFTGELADKNGTVQKAGRNIVKTPLTAMVFGSSTGKAVDSMANKFIDSIYSSIESTAKGEVGAQSREKLIANLNVLLGLWHAPKLRTDLTISQLMETELTPEQVKALKESFSNTLGKAVRETMETDFSTFISRRKQFNLAAQTAFALYNSTYTALREELVAELVKSGEIAVNEKTKEPLHDLTPAQEGELRKRLARMEPVMHTLMSKDSGSLKAGLAISKSGRKLAETKKVEVNGKTVERETPYAGTVKFGTGFPVTNEKSTTTRAYVNQETAPGVAMAPMSVHSTDSAISHYAADGNEVLNVHDAHGAGLANFEQTARNLNQATWNAMLNYSPASELMAALSRTVVGMAELVKSGDLPASVMENLAQELGKIASKQEMDPDTFLRDLVEGMKDTAYRADDMKLRALERMQAIDQYALQGGNYVVTDKDRSDAAALRARLSDALSKEEKAAIETIEKALEQHQKSQQPKEALPLEEDGPTTKPNPFGTVGKPRVKSDEKLVAFLRANPKTTAKELIKHLAGSIDKTSFAFQLLKVLNKTVDPNTVIKLVTPDTPESEVKEKPDRDAHAWAVVGSETELYFLSSEFAASGMTIETALHELTHAALVKLVEMTKSQGRKGPAVEVVKELEQLMSLAQAYAKQQGITKWNASAFENIHEFISWGMTNQEFQDTILKRISMDSRTQGGLVNGMKAFIEKLVGLLFQGSSKPEQERALTGMAVLVGNVTQLFAEAAEVQGGPATRVVLAQASGPMGAVQNFTTMDIHAALDSTGVTPEFDAQLRSLLGGIVEKLHGPYGAFKALMSSAVAPTPLDVWQKALDTGVAPFAASVKASPIAASEQELHAMEQVEAVVKAALDSKEASVTTAFKELKRLYAEMREAVKPSDFASQAEYDFIFGVRPDASGRSDHLARFAAFGLAHQGFNLLIQRATDTRIKARPQSFAERIQRIFEQILEFFQDWYTKTYAGQQADQKLETLVGQLVDIEARKKVAIAKRAAGNSPVDTVNAIAKDVGEKARKTLGKAAGSSFISNSRFAAVRAAGKLTKIYANDQVEGLMKTLSDFRDRSHATRHGVAMGLVGELRGPGKTLNALQLASTNQQKERKQLISNTSKVVLKAFANGGTDLTAQAKRGISQVFLRTGMHVLTDSFNMTELENLVASEQARDAAITSLENQLNGFGRIKEHFLNQANDLGFYKATGLVKNKKLMMNAHNIARLYGTAYVGRLSRDQVAQVEPVIEQLVALYALRHTAPAMRSQALEVIRSENARTDGGGNGVEFTLKLHKRLDQESKERLFRGQQALAMHGYTPDIYNPNTEAVTADAVVGKELEDMGYVKLGDVSLDPADPDRTPKGLYILKDGGLVHRVTGSISYTGKRAKGTTVHSGYLNVNTADGLENAMKHADIINAKGSGLDLGPLRDPKTVLGTFLAPVVNPQGEIVNWRYLMNDQSKDEHLERDNRFENLLGVLAGSIYDKESTTEINTKVLEALKEQYDAEKGSQSHAFLLIGPRSTDPEMRELWSMLPDDTKAAARRIWGKDGIRIRKDAVTPVFGYRKFTLAELFHKDPARSGDSVEKTVVALVEYLLYTWKRLQGGSHDEGERFAKQAAVRVAKSERIWQELMHEVKDILVVKTGVVMLGNIWSNWSLLAMQGVGLKDIVQGHLVALRGARAYQADSERLAELQALVDTGLARGQAADIDREIKQLQDSLARNPVKELIDAGLMPTIVEDVAQDDDIYSYKSVLVRKAEALSEKLNPNVVIAAKNIYMAHDTKVYQGLSRITQLSDFVARYTLYQHLTTRNVNPLGHEDAIHEASESFVNYDVPMHRGMQYLDDMGVVMFTKYFLRIQRVLLKLFRERPAQVLMTYVLQNFLDLGPIVLDSGWMHKVGNNPLSVGALQLPGVIDELATVNAGMALVK